MNYKKYINMMLLQLSNKYQFTLTDIKTYKKNKKYTTIKLIIYKYKNEDEKQYYKTVEVKNDRELILKLKEMI